MADKLLLEPTQLGDFTLSNRIVMAPMTRARTAQPGNVPTALMAEYYQQRASAGLIVTEATQISPEGQGYSWTPGIHTPEQIVGWKGVTDAVHRAGGRIFLQLWHVGRMSHPSFHPNGLALAPSALPFEGQVWIVDDKGQGHMVDCLVPREMTDQDIHQVINEYRQAAINAIDAGFDGVEVHGGNGYLVDQFLRRTSNHRTDQYGGSLNNRIRFAQDVLTAISDAIGVQRTAIRLAPFITQRGMNDPEAIDAILALAKWADEKGIAYIHLAEADWDDAPTIPDTFRVALRAAFKGNLIVAGNYTVEKAEAYLRAGWVDQVAFGRPFVSNPDLPARIAHDIVQEKIIDPSTLFGGGKVGYTDYPKFNFDVVNVK
ncbi:alkene reductase [Candidatus Pantoea formicae]|uniref:alkene reductase n=1 Tax=Candidatus Pantoea formicae TaxID=2608355 RepID=UPI003EDA5B37